MSLALTPPATATPSLSETGGGLSSKHQIQPSEQPPRGGETSAGSTNSPLSVLSTSAVNRSWADHPDTKPAPPGDGPENVKVLDDPAQPMKTDPPSPSPADLAPAGPPAAAGPAQPSNFPPSNTPLRESALSPGDSRSAKRARTPSPDLASSAGPSPQGLAHLLGSGISRWTHGEESLTEALKLRAEQERTKQEYYRLENRKRSLELLNTAMRAGVPGPAIPILFNASGGSGTGLPAALPAQSPGQPSPINTNMRAAAAAAAAVAVNTSPSTASPSVEIINYEDARGASHYRPTHSRSASAMPFGASRPVTQAYYPRPAAPNAGSSSTIQFHHWKPNQQQQQARERPSAGSPNRRDEKHHSPIQAASQPQVSGQPQPAQQSQQPQQPPPQPSPSQTHIQPAPQGPNAASVVAQHQAKRRSMGHVRHRSDVGGAKWYGGRDEGVSILASMASERNRHDVGFILDSPQRGARRAGSPGPVAQQNVGPNQGHPGPIGQPGPPAPQLNIPPPVSPRRQPPREQNP